MMIVSFVSLKESPEIKVLVPLLKRFGTVIAITGNTGFLAKVPILF
jgi:hypothetical protein